MSLMADVELCFHRNQQSEQSQGQKPGASLWSWDLRSATLVARSVRDATFG